jgi:uncharacterized protein (TIRG00374 family)
MVAAAGLLYVGLPRLAGLDDVWRRLSSGDPLLLCTAALLECAAYAAYVWTFHRLFSGPGSRIGWKESYDISLAGAAASRVVATAGAGGIALSAWALDRSGMERKEVVSGLTTFYVLLYGLFMAALVAVGTGLRSGVLHGSAPFALTVVPAIVGGVVIVAGLVAAGLPSDLGQRVAGRLHERERLAKWVGRAADAAATLAAGVRGALSLTRARDPALVGAFLWWAFDIGVLWVCFAGLGEAPPGGVVVMGYLTGTLGNVVPLPGGLGGVEGAMIGAFVGFGVAPGLAVAAVLGYRAFEYWLPIIPGVLAYPRLRRTSGTGTTARSRKACDDGSHAPASELTCTRKHVAPGGIMSEHAAQRSAGTPVDLKADVSKLTGYWWLGLVAGIAWLVISLVILQFDNASITTVGVLVGLMFLLAGVQNVFLTTLPVEHRWVSALFSVLFLISAVICFVSPVSTVAGLADMLGFLFLVVGIWWMTQAFLERPVNSLWWTTLISGILMTGLAFWASGQLFTTKLVTLLIFAGFWALMQGILDITRAFSVREVHKEL